jgi:hypothetical protein
LDATTVAMITSGAGEADTGFLAVQRWLRDDGNSKLQKQLKLQKQIQGFFPFATLEGQDDG